MTARSRLARVLATWFGCGLSPIAPGTAGSLGAIPLVWIAARGGPTATAIAAVLATLVGVWAAGVVARDLGAHDPQIVVIDEVAGMLVTMIPVTHLTWRALLAGFALFRLLDATKPWPIRRFEKLPGGWGIVLDDVVAGIAGAAILALLERAGVLP